MSLAGKRTVSLWYFRRFLSNSLGLIGFDLSSGAEAAVYNMSVDVNRGELVLGVPADEMSSNDFGSWSSFHC